MNRAHVVAAERLKERDVASAREMKERDVAVSMQNARAQQTNVVNTFMEALLSENTRRRQQAIKAVLIALPRMVRISSTPSGKRRPDRRSPVRSGCTDRAAG
jgi:hypothetical protein